MQCGFKLGEDIVATLRDTGPKTRTREEPVGGHCEHPFRERTKAELLDDLKTSMEQVLAGEFRPALEVLDELDHEAMDNADTG